MEIFDWGLIDFHEALRRQQELVDAVLFSDHPDVLVFCEHPPVITLGRTTQDGGLVVSAEALEHRGIEVVKINRGGEATVHSPGQLVGYPICNLNRSKPDLHWFLRTIEQSVIDALGEYGILGHRVDGLTGVWVDNSRKICAIGLHCSRWVTSHGFALNVTNDLSFFDTIIPCGIHDKGVTSVAGEILNKPTMESIKKSIGKAFLQNFSASI